MRRLLLFGLLTGELAAQTLVDVQQVPALGDWRSAIVRVPETSNPEEIRCDVLVAGAGMGGTAAALVLAKRGHSVCLTEETDWVGGQMTAGGVSALDENKFIETTGGTRTYYEMRNAIRQHYRTRYKLRNPLENLNPGSCYVSSLCFEPRAGVDVLEQMLVKQGVKPMLRTQVFSLDVKSGRIQSALAWQFDRKRVIRIVPRFVLDATELGDLLPLSKVPYVVGSEPKSETNEPHAAAQANPACVQSFTYPFVIEHRPGESHRIAKPPDYEKIRDGQPFSLRMYYPEEYGWKGHVQYTVFGDDAPVPNNMSPKPFFPWRRLLAARNFAGGEVPNDVALMNWPRQDYHSESLLDRTPDDFARVLQKAKQVSLAFLYWLQTDTPRDGNAGKGHPEFKLRADLMGSGDGLSKYPYIRESRRLRAKGRVVEQDIVSDYQTGPRARFFADSVGTGFYMVDIHPCGANERGRMMMPRPFQVPMSTLVPQGVENLLAAGKNIGVTHLTNGAFRLHPIEWNIGEAAATMASMALRGAGLPAVPDLQAELVKTGVQIFWFDDLPPSHPAFAAIQMAAIRGLYPVDASGLHASPDAPVTRREAASALAAFYGQKTSDPVKLAVEKGWMAVDHRNWFHEDLPFYWTDCRADLPTWELRRTGPVTRSEFAQRLTGLR